MATKPTGKAASGRGPSKGPAKDLAKVLATEDAAPADLSRALDEAVRTVAGTAGLTEPAAVAPAMPVLAAAVAELPPKPAARRPRQRSTAAASGAETEAGAGAARVAQATTAGSAPANPAPQTAATARTAAPVAAGNPASSPSGPDGTEAREEDAVSPPTEGLPPTKAARADTGAVEAAAVDAPAGGAPAAQIGAADADELAAAYRAATVHDDAQPSGPAHPAAASEPPLSRPNVASPEAASRSGAPSRSDPTALAASERAPAPSPTPAAAPAALQPRLDAANPLTAPELSARLAENIERIETLGQRLIRALASQPLHAPGVDGPGPSFYATTTQAWVRMAAEQPARIIEQQVQFWGETLRHVARAQQAFALQGFAAPADDTESTDRRFANPLWRTNPFFSFVRKQYLINAGAMKKAVADLDLHEGSDRHRVDWFTRQIIDMLSPTNFLATNPDALEKAIATEGESLVRGLENLVQDIEANRGDLVVSLADRDAFRVGENIGTTAGEVVHRTPLFELIQFHPLTEQVHRTPVVVFPPWINKFYIMDLKPQNSLLRWLVEQGHTLFVVSWKNPDQSYADTGMEDYVSAYLDAMDKVAELTGERQVNAVGYCIGGTTLSLAVGVLDQRGDDRVKSATLFTTLTDFRDPGDFVTFLQDDFVAGIEGEVGRVGYLSAQLMQRTMSFLRANDLVWAPAIRNYMLGEAPPAFDLLFWNGDGTNLPGRMVVEYLRGLCQANLLPGEGFPVLGTRVSLRDIKVPLCSIACEGDHIAPWLNCWAGVAQMASQDRTFILSESGHIAGIINPPSRVKYGHYTSDAGFDGNARQWKGEATYHSGSWWPRWGEWLQRFAGGTVAARRPAHSLAPAPGTYVHEKA